MLEIFRKKDPPILTLEEMATNAEGIERLVVILKGDKTTADVSGILNLLTFCMQKKILSST